MRGQVELDRLADYAAGLLDGTPGAAEVAELIATEPDWASAYAALVDAEPTVRADLAGLGGTAGPMPADVVARLDSALAEAGNRPRLSVLPGGSARPGSSAGSAVLPGGSVVPGGSAGVRTAASRARRRRRAWVAAIAAGLVALAGFGVTVGADLTGGRNATDSGLASSRERSAAEPAAGALDDKGVPPQLPGGTAGPRLAASGTDYRTTDLGTTQKWSGLSADLLAPGPSSEAGQQRLSESLVPPSLRRLVDPAALGACLRQLTTGYGGVVRIVDYARFETEPALVVLLVDPAGRPVRVVVAGPRCGLPPQGGDVRHTAPVG